MGAYELDAGAVIGGEFEVVRKLDAGGMGVVYEVEQRSVGRRRALKVMHPELAANPARREAFLREARVASRIESEHVVEVLGAGYDPSRDSLWLAMELLRGETLAQRSQARGAMTLTEILGVFRALGHVLAAAHRVGVVHCDLKPENVFYARSRRSDAPEVVKVLDFGIAKVVQEFRTSTLAHDVEGSPRWMAPEQATFGGRIKGATDVWALGMIAFHLLTGTHYWFASQRSTGVMPLLTEIISGEMEPASARARQHGFAGALPDGFDAWFATCVDRDVDRRFREATEAVETLAALAHPARSSDPPRIDGTMVLPGADSALVAARMALADAERAGAVEAMLFAAERLAELTGSREDLARAEHERASLPDRARELYFGGRYAEAAAAWSVAVERDPSNPRWRFARGAAWSALRDWRRADEDLGRALELDDA